MRQYTLFASLLLMVLLLGACSSSTEAPAGAQEAETTRESAERSTPVEELAAQPTDTVAPTASPETPAGQPGDALTREFKATEPAAIAGTPTPELPTDTAAPQFNGEYEETFYRGLATAPITMIDYSDFL